MFKAILPSIAGILFCTVAAAAQQPLIRVTAEAFPGEEYTIGLEVNADQSVRGVYYEDRFQPALSNQIRHYPMKDVIRGVTLLEKQKYKLIVLSAEAVGETEYVVNLRYLVNALTSKKREVEFRIKKNLSTGNFDVTEVESGKVLREAYVETNTIFGKQVGIKKIRLL